MACARLGHTVLKRGSSCALHTNAPSYFYLQQWMRTALAESLVGNWIFVWNNPFLISIHFLSEALEINRADLVVLYKFPDRPNIFSQRRILKKPVDVM